MRSALWLALVLAALLWPAQPSWAADDSHDYDNRVAPAALGTVELTEEAIRDFDSRVVLATDGTVDVTETITVNAQGDQIQHGIFRDIVTILRNADGSQFYAGLTVLGVTQDGHPEPYTVQSLAYGDEIRIGDPDVLIDYGQHTYVIHYTMTRQARFFASHDEVFWNATGNFWNFPILKATAEITLPPGGKIDRLVAYTGVVGSRAEDATIARTGDGAAVFTSTRELNPGEGMTIGVSFPKGIVLPPTGPAATADWLSDHRALVAPPVALLIVLLFNLLAWKGVGRGSKRGAVPFLQPPAGMSPALVHWVHGMGWQKHGRTAIVASIVDLAVKGLVTIEQADKSFTVTALGEAPVQLPTGEAQLNSYFRNCRSLTIGKSTGSDFARISREALSAIEVEHKGFYFKSNAGYGFASFLLGAGCLGALLLLGVLDLDWLVLATIAGAVFSVIIAMARRVIGVAAGVILFFFCGIGLASVVLSRENGTIFGNFPPPVPMTAAVLIALVTFFFAFLMRGPTVAGRPLMREIDGFLLYLDTLDKSWFSIPDEPRLTAKRFETLLPFAIALGVEKRWSDKFGAALAAGRIAGFGTTAYEPGWYGGASAASSHLASHTGATGLSTDIAGATLAMSAALAAATPALSSSSSFSGGDSGGGGGGGGSDGGGGGGDGGGGGW